MKYHYKTPAQLREELEQNHLKNKKKKRNQINLIIFIDLFIITLVFGFLYYSGLLTQTKAPSESTLYIQQLQVSGSISGIDAKQDHFLCYLNLKNNGEKDIIVPDLKGQFQIDDIEIEIISNGAVQFAQSLYFKPDTIAPGETRIVPLKVEYNREKMQTLALVRPTLRMKVGGSRYLLNFPDIRIQKK